MDGTSRVTGDSHARFCERLGVKFPGATRRCRVTGIPTATAEYSNVRTPRNYVDGFPDPEYRENRALPSIAAFSHPIEASNVRRVWARLPAVSSGFLAFLRFTPCVS